MLLEERDLSQLARAELSRFFVEIDVFRDSPLAEGIESCEKGVLGGVFAEQLSAQFDEPGPLSTELFFGVLLGDRILKSDLDDRDVLLHLVEPVSDQRAFWNHG